MWNFGNFFEKLQKFGGKLVILKKKNGNLEKIWKFVNKNLEILKNCKFGNLEKIVSLEKIVHLKKKMRKNLFEIWKKNWKFAKHLYIQKKNGNIWRFG